MPSCRILALTALALACVATGAHARGQLQTRQTGVDMPAGVRAGRLVLANSGDKPVAAQIRVYKWTQEGAEDVLDPSNELTASPAIVEIPAGAEQLVRVVRPGTTPLTAEQAYRVVVDELPGDPDTDATNAVTVRMRFVLPAFVRAPDAAPAELACSVGGGALTCRNGGGRAAQLGATTLVAANGKTAAVTPGLLGYVLAGSTRRFPLEAATLAAAGTPASLQTVLNGQPTTLALGPAP